jgi:basic membrane protein A
MNYEEYFQSALKKGQKEYSKNKSDGVSGHLPSLEGLLKDIEIVSNVQLGVVEIPLKKVIGCYSNTRRIAFAKNFMPLNSGTEFKSKWMAVSEAHLNEGLRDPVKVYEFMNWYYVVEGNKRVSVLKYFNGYSVMAQVTRLIPKRDPEDDSIECYYAFLELNKVTGYIDYWFSKASRFYRFMDLLEHYEPKMHLYENKYKHFDSFVFQPFRRLYKECGGDNIRSITTGDAFLEYARVYGMENELDESKQLQPIRQLVEELKVSSVEDRNIITEELDEPSKRPFLSSLSSLLRTHKKLKIGFVHARNIENSGWTLAHDLGRLEMEASMSDDVETHVVYNVIESHKAYKEIQNLVDLGMDVIFTTSEVFKKQTLRCALENPNVLFFNCSESRPYLHMSNYYGKTYEPKYLMGLLAGIYTRTDKIGYLASVPNAENLASINAFAIGVKTVNSDAVVLVDYTLSWNSLSKNHEAEEKLLAEGVDVIANKVVLEQHHQTELLKKRGVFSYLAKYCGEDEWQPLAAGYWNWGTYYQKIVSAILNQSYEEVLKSHTAGSRLINLYWGMSSNVLDLWLSPEIAKQTNQLIRQMKRLIVSDSMSPFDGPLRTVTGEMVCDEEATLDTEYIIEMDWYYENVKVIGKD